MPLTVSAINAIHDWLHRGAAAPSLPGSWHYVLLSELPSVGNPNGVEITTGGVARVAVERNTVDWSGTQGAGTTGASSGTSSPGVVRNNTKITFAAAASAAVAGAVAVGLMSASSGGTLWEWAYLTAGGVPVTRAWSSGDEIAIAISDMQWQLS